MPASKKRSGKLKPADPVYAVYPEKFAAAVKRFLDLFSRRYLLLGKGQSDTGRTQPALGRGHPALRHRFAWRDRDRRKPFSRCALPFHGSGARIPGHAKAAFEKYGVTDYVVDCDFELDKLIAETKAPGKLRIFVRLATQLGGALLELSSKYGVRHEEAAAALLKRIADAGAAPCLTFHVGSQCLSPFSYAQAIEIARRTIVKAGIDIAALDIGGGFPGPYASHEVPPFHWYFDTIREAPYHARI